MSFSAKPNFGLLFQGGARFDPFEAVSASQRNQQLGIQAAQVAQQREQAELNQMMNNQRLRASQEATQLQNRQAANALVERQRNRKQNKVMTQNKLEQDLYLKEQDMRQQRIEADLARRQQMRMQQEREAASRRNMEIQGKINRDLQTRRIEAERQERQQKQLAERQKQQQQQTTRQEVNKAIDRGDFDTVARLVGPEEALKLEKTKKSINKESAESAKLSGYANTALRLLSDYGEMLDKGEITDGTYAGIDYVPNFASNLALTQNQRKVRTIRDNITDAVARLRTGAAVTEDEAQRFQQLLPNLGDDEATSRFKLENIRKEIKQVLESKGGESANIRKDEQKRSTGDGQDQIRNRRRQVESRLKQMEQELKRRGLVQ